jgi:hypothetical protein
MDKIDLDLRNTYSKKITNNILTFDNQLEVFQKYSHTLTNEDNYLIYEKIHKKVHSFGKKLNKLDSLNKIVFGGADPECSKDLVTFEQDFDKLIKSTNLVTTTMQNKIDELKEIIKKIIANEKNTLANNSKIANISL